MSKPVGHGGQDTPDWGISVSAQRSNVLQDLGELAVRLGSPVIYDRLGNVIFIETFKYGKDRWTETTQGDGSSINLVGTYYMREPPSLRLICDATEGDFAQITARTNYSVLSLIGLEVSFHTQTAFDYLAFFLYVYTGTEIKMSSVLIRAKDEQVIVYDNTPSEQVIGTIKTTGSVPVSWYTLKWVIDPINDDYVRVFINAESFDPTGNGLSVSTSNYEPQLYFGGILLGDGLTTDTVYIDNIIITINEPR